MTTDLKSSQNENKYNTLVKILDELRKEAPEQYKFYHALETNIEDLNYARSRTFIHLFLKVKFGLLTFQEREQFVTDGPGDGGIDGFYIDKEQKKIFLIQAKFRRSSNNFESKEIEYSELLDMDIKRITSGEKCYDNGSSYNAKILKLQEKLCQIEDIARYDYKIIILANTKHLPQQKLRMLTNNNPVEEYNFDRVYNELVFPIISGTFYNISQLTLSLNLSNKSSEDITYSVETEKNTCDITVVFVPTIEIAKALYKYKNSILKYNPRSYLDMASGSINAEISKTIISKKTNEFALFNNGITILSDSTDLKKQIGIRGRGQVLLTNPQIINGGQTAYTLSRIYEEVINHTKDSTIFDNKEVLVKIITFTVSDLETSTEFDKLELIEAISKATNQQTAVQEADRRSNESSQIFLQKEIFKNFGMFYERKKGEFGEGLRDKYIDRSQIIEREQFLRLVLAAEGEPSQARRNSDTVLFKKENFDRILCEKNLNQYQKYIFAYNIFIELSKIQRNITSLNNKDGILNYGYALRYGKYAVIAAIMKYYDQIAEKDVLKIISEFLKNWQDFEKVIVSHEINRLYFREEIVDETGNKNFILNYDGFYKGRTLNEEIKQYDFLGKNII